MTTTQEAITLPGVETETTAAEKIAVNGIINPREILHIAWEGVLRNKIRSLLTMLGVIIGVAAVIIMMAISAGTEATN